MESTYSIFYYGSAVGTVSVKKQGLYYQFSAKCKPMTTEVCRLEAACGEKRTSLGVCVPSDGMLTLQTRLPVKTVGEEELGFRLLTKTEAEDFYPICENERFDQLDKLAGAKLCICDHQQGIMLPKKSPDQPDSDQNP